ncbi:MAG: catalase [Candidatus Dormibacteria bacterium]
MDLPAGLGNRLVATLHTVHGEHAGHRAAHAKGSCCAATFRATSAGAQLTRAAHFQGGAIPATVRFSNGSGIPAYPDYARSDGRGMAVKFRLPGDAHADMVALTLPVFFARDPESFMDFLLVTRPDPQTRQPDLARIGAYLEQHPETQAALGAAMATDLPASYLRVRYNGIHAFRLVSSSGQATWVRYRWEPELGEAKISSDEARSGGREYLQDELRASLTQGAAAFGLVFVVAAPSDSLTDPTSAWPDDRETVLAGRLEVTAAEPAEACDSLIFDPTSVVDGIELPADPILHARSAAYAVSYAARRGMTAPPSTTSMPDAPAAAGRRAKAAAGDVAPGAIKAVDVDGARVAVANVDGTLCAFQDTCPHRGCSLADGALDGKVVTCPCHGSRFDVISGEVLKGPAKESIATFT